MVNYIKLKVAEAHQDDINKGIVRVDSQILRSLNIAPGQAIGIEGGRKTVAIADRAYPSDLGLEIIRMDGIIRKNAKISVGEQIKIFKPVLKEATKITLIPMQEFIVHPTTLVNIKKGLFRKPVCNSDIITISNSSNSSVKRSSFSSSNPFAIDLFATIESEFLGFNLSLMKFKVSNAKPNSDFLIITNNTEILISNSTEGENETGVNYEDIGGLKSQLKKIKELVELPLKHPELFIQLGVDAPKGILLHGPPGTGKTLLARAIANETEASFYSISAPEIVNKYYGESEKKLRELFEKAEKDSPAVIFIDEIDAIAVKREEVQGETEKRIVAQLLTLMDGIKKNKRVIIIAATNRVDALDEALRRPGRFDRELEIGVPKEKDRLEILKIHSRGMPLELPDDFKYYEKELISFIENVKNKKEDSLDEDLNLDINEIKSLFKKNKFDALKQIPKKVVLNVRRKQADKMLKEIAKVTHGFVGADLEALVKEAAFNVVRRTFPNMEFGKEEKEISKDILFRLEITKEDFAQGLKVVRPSAMREFLVEVPNVKYEDIGGLESIKQNLIEMIDWPLKNPNAFKRLGITAPSGILLYGPPGTGKTLLAKAVATETSSNFIYIKGPEIINKYVGESEKAIRKIFQKARQNSPCILFFDEFDAIASTRLEKDKSSMGTIVNQILTEIDGLEDLINVKVLAATNRPGLIDPALLRPGRFDKLILVDIPDLKARKSIFEINLKKTPVENKDEMVLELAKKTEGYVGADIEAVVREAGMIALRRDINSKEVSKNDFYDALKIVRPSINVELQKYYQEIEKEMKKPQKKMSDELSMSSYM